MALIVITIADEGDGRVDVKALSEPRLPIGHPDDATPAHGVALTILTALAEQEGAETAVQ